MCYDYKGLVARLRKMSQGENVEEGIGVCFQFGSSTPSVTKSWKLFKGSRYYLECLEAWRYYSGNTTYPIKSPLDAQGAEEAFDEALDNDSMWKGKYGKRRKELCAVLADYIEAKLVVPDEIDILMGNLDDATIKAAKACLAENIRFNSYGICGNYIDAIELKVGRNVELDRLVILLCKEAQCYSGHKAYPIKHYNKRASTAYYDLDKWSKRTKYGKQRWAVLERMRELVNNEFIKRKLG